MAKQQTETRATEKKNNNDNNFHGFQHMSCAEIEM